MKTILYSVSTIATALKRMVTIGAYHVISDGMLYHL